MKEREGAWGLLAKQKTLIFYYSLEDTLVKYAAEYREIGQQLKEREEQGEKYYP